VAHIVEVVWISRKEIFSRNVYATLIESASQVKFEGFRHTFELLRKGNPVERL
jgi:hypothetical protein